MRLSQLSQPGNLFFQRLTEDKVVAAFVISIIFFFLIVEYLDSPSGRKLILVGITALAMAFTHPVQFGMACMIAGVYGLPSLFSKNSLRAYFTMIGVLAMIVLIPYLFRFDGGEYSQTLSFSLEDVAKNDSIDRLGSRIDIVEGTQFYGISRTLTPGLPYEIGLISSVISIFFFLRYKFARYILSAFLVLGASMFPYTGWLVGLFTTPFQLWRLTWLMPFGLAFAFLIWIGFEDFQRIKFFQSHHNWILPAYYVSVYIGLMIALVLIRPYALDNVETRNLNEVEIYDNYLRVAQFMNKLDVKQPIIIGGPDAVTNSIIPSLTMKFEPLFFRVEVNSRRSQSWKFMVEEGLLPEERLTQFQENNVEYLLIKGRPDWIAVFSQTYPDSLTLLLRDERLSLYKITR
jgi:hypothetical protein